MKKINLPHGQYALVDDKDFKYLSNFKWGFHVRADTGYAITQIKNKTCYMHRVILKAKKGLDVDHINGNGLDNRKDNLRLCTRSQNMFNTPSHKDALSKFKGVCWDKSKKKWKAEICINYKKEFLGRYDLEEEAALAYNEAAIKCHGEFVRLNEVSIGMG